MPPETFVCIDEWAGYFVSRRPVVPTRVQVVDDLLAALVDCGVELRFVPNLWPLRDAVVSSTLRFSIIRMRNALPPPLPMQLPHRTAQVKDAVAGWVPGPLEPIDERGPSNKQGIERR
jgi:hypothetical protein